MEYCENGIDWKTLLRLTNLTENAPLITLETPILSSRWRVRRIEEGYVSLGLFKLYTYPQHYDASTIDQISTPLAQPLHFELKMSSAFNECGNTFQALQNEQGTEGAGTEEEPSPYMIASFDSVYRLTFIRIKPIRKSDWGKSYLSKCRLQYSVDGCRWIEIKQLLHLTEELNTIVLEKVSAKHIRIMKDEEGYIGVGTLIVFGSK